jgi:hypothetical protein
MAQLKCQCPSLFSAGSNADVAAALRDIGVSRGAEIVLENAARNDFTLRRQCAQRLQLNEQLTGPGVCSREHDHLGARHMNFILNIHLHIGIFPAIAWHEAPQDMSIHEHSLRGRQRRDKSDKWI